MNFSEVRSENQNVGLSVLTFSESTRGKVDEDYLGIVKAVANLTRMAAKRYYSEAIIPVKYYDDVKTDYQTYNAKVSKALFGYAIDQTYGLENFEKASAIRQNQMMTSKEVERLAFAIVVEALVSVVADNEVEDSLLFANIVDCDPKDSKSFTIDSKMIYPIQNGGFGANVSRYNQSYMSSITLTPKPKDCSVSFPFHELRNGGYDFGREIAKVAISFRAQQYADIINEVFSVTSALTPFYETTFSVTNYMTMAEKIRSLNSSEVQAYGTALAFNALSGNVVTGFSVQDELVKNGYITDLYGIRTIVVPNAINTITSQLNQRVPNDVILLISGNDGDKPVKMVRSRTADVYYKDGNRNEEGLDRLVYWVRMYWDVGLVTKSHFGVQVV